MNMQVKAFVVQTISARVKITAVQQARASVKAKMPEMLYGRIKVIASPGDLSAYEGSYTITPKVSEQTLETQGMRMADDVVVQAIPYYAVDNAYRGQTIIIGDGGNGD